MTPFERELERQIPALRRFAWSLTRHSEEADDLVQDCLERALGRAGSFRGQGTQRAWLFSILYHRFLSDRRRAARRPQVALDLAPEPAVSGGQEGRIALTQMLEALDHLSEEQRAVVVLVGVEDLSYEEAARVLDVPVGTVMSRLSRGREHLRRLLAGEAPRAQLRAIR